MTADEIEARFLATVHDPANGYKVDGAERIADRDAARLVGISSRHARELREMGKAWPRYDGIVIDGCRYGVFISELAQWYAQQLKDAS